MRTPPGPGGHGVILADTTSGTARTQPQFHFQTKAAIRFLDASGFSAPTPIFPEIRFRLHPAPGNSMGSASPIPNGVRDQEQGGKLVSNLYQIPQKEEFEAAPEQAQNSRFGTPLTPERFTNPLSPIHSRVYNPTKGWYEFEVPSGIDNMDPYYNGRFVARRFPRRCMASSPRVLVLVEQQRGH